MTLPQPRRAKSSIALREQAASQQRNLKAPPLPTKSIFPPTPPLSTTVSTRSASTSTVSSGLRTPPQQLNRPSTITSPPKQVARKTSSGITERLKLVTNELESYVEENSPDDDHNNVHVAVRLKPSFGVEREVWVSDPLRGYIGSKLGDFFFDYMYTGEDTNYGVYDASVKRLVRKAAEGYNATVFAYGQTSSGKTHTMRGHADEAGIIPLAVADLFEEISQQRDRDFTLKVTYLEIYNEKIRDLLLDPNLPQPAEIKLHEKNGQVKALPLTEYKLTKVDDMALLLLRGDAARMTAATEFNNVSSRSHAVMQITIESRDRSRKVRTSTLSMIDLAGSEKASSQDTRRKEGAYINKSLLTLGTVISRLTTPNQTTNTSPTPYSTPSTPQANHVPFRDSKLTRLLQPSLSGGGFITILATICGGQKYSAETLSTLQFAKRAKKIPAKAVLQGSFDEGFAGEAELRNTISTYKTQIEDLQKQLLEAQSKANVEEMGTLKVEREQLNNRIERLSVLALAAGDSRNPIVQQTIAALESELSTRYDYCEILEKKVENLKRERRDEVREWRRKVEEKDLIIAELQAQLGPKRLPKIDTRVLPSTGSSPVSAGAASYLRSFNPFGRAG